MFLPKPQRNSPGHEKAKRETWCIFPAEESAKLGITLIRLSAQMFF